METAAGVTPAMRLACPIDRGRTWRSFSRTSRDRPAIASRSSDSGKGSSSSFAHARDLVVLPRDVALVLELGLDVLGEAIVGDAAERGAQGDVAELGPTQELGERGRFAQRRKPERHEAIVGGDARREHGLTQPTLLGFDRLSALLERAPALVVDEPERTPARHHALGGVVFAQGEPMLGARGHHAIGLVGALGGEVVDEHARVGFVSREDELLAVAAHGERRVGTGDEPLDRRFLVARGAVDLPCEIEALRAAVLERGLKLAWVTRVVLHRVARSRELGALETGDGAHERALHVERQARRDAVRIDLERVEAFGLEKDLVAGLVGEADDLVFDRRAVTRTHAVDRACRAVERRA